MHTSPFSPRAVEVRPFPTTDIFEEPISRALLNMEWSSWVAGAFDKITEQISEQSTDFDTLIAIWRHLRLEGAILSMNTQSLNIDLVSNKTTTSTSFVDVSGAIVSYTPTKSNCQIAVRNMLSSHSSAAEHQFRVRADDGTEGQEAISVQSGTTQRSSSCTIKYSNMPVGELVTIQLQWKVSGGTATLASTSWLNVEIIEWDD